MHGIVESFLGHTYIIFQFTLNTQHKFPLWKEEGSIYWKPYSELKSKRGKNFLIKDSRGDGGKRFHKHS